MCKYYLCYCICGYNVFVIALQQQLHAHYLLVRGVVTLAYTSAYSVFSGCIPYCQDNTTYQVDRDEEFDAKWSIVR